MDSETDELEKFLEWWLENRVFHSPFDTNAMLFNMESIGLGDNVTGFILYREGQFQVQLFICKPYTEIPIHVHPNMDSYEVYLNGQLSLRINDEIIMDMDQFETESGVSSNFGQAIRVRPQDRHGGPIVAMGGAFLSVQHWLNGVAPSSASIEYVSSP